MRMEINKVAEKRLSEYQKSMSQKYQSSLQYASSKCIEQVSAILVLVHLPSCLLSD